MLILKFSQLEVFIFIQKNIFSEETAIFIVIIDGWLADCVMWIVFHILGGRQGNGEVVRRYIG